MEEYNTEQERSKQEKRIDWPTIGSYVIIFLCVVLLIMGLALLFIRSYSNNPKVIRVIVTTNVVPDSTKAYTYISYSQADSLIRIVKNYDDKLTQKYQYLVEQKEQDTQLFYWGSMIAGLVVALFGWFGFKSFYAIERKAIDKSIETAGKNARKVASNYWKRQGEKLINTAATTVYKEQEEALKKQIHEEINKAIECKIEKILTDKGISQLPEHLDNLESNYKRIVEQSVETTFDDFIEKLRSNRRKGNKTNSGKEVVE